MKNFLAVMVLSISFMGQSQAFADDHVDKTEEEAAVMAVIHGLFEAMYNADSTAHSVLIAPETTMDRVRQNGETVRGKASDWTNSIATMTPGSVDEKLMDVKIMIEGPLAMVWAPFDLVVEGKRVSCGVNQFTLAKGAEGWKVVYGIDTHTPQKCGL